MNHQGDHVFNVFIEKDHPACDGHFDQNPLLPGVVTLEYVRLAIKECYPQMKVKSFNKVKFTHNLKPGETLFIHLEKPTMGVVNFKCLDSKDHQIAIGSLVAG